MANTRMGAMGMMAFEKNAAAVVALVNNIAHAES